MFDRLERTIFVIQKFVKHLTRYFQRSGYVLFTINRLEFKRTVTNKLFHKRILIPFDYKHDRIIITVIRNHSIRDYFYQLLPVSLLIYRFKIHTRDQKCNHFAINS